MRTLIARYLVWLAQHIEDRFIACPELDDHDLDHDYIIRCNLRESTDTEFEAFIDNSKRARARLLRRRAG